MKVEEVITARIIEKLEAGTVPWHRPWSGADMPKNLISKKEYRGINVFILSAMGFGSPYWVSFKQAQELGGNVRKGEKGCPVVFWKWLESMETDENGNQRKATHPILRYYTVFNVLQIDGIDDTKIPALAQKYNEREKIESCENVVANMPKRPEIIFDYAGAFFRPTTDTVNMPKIETFDSSEEYYSTLFHELTHSTGHETRLNRRGSDVPRHFGDSDYSKEELVAEMGAAFLCGHCQIENKTIDNSAAYIANWLRKFKDDAKMVIMAGGAAQKAVDFILGRKVAEE
jgi:antirestriction protein ArdC